MNYIERAYKILCTKINVEHELTMLYVLLVLTKKGHATLEDVHDAWSVWRNIEMPSHKSIIPFNNLTLERQEKDMKYAKAINETYQELQNELC